MKKNFLIKQNKNIILHSGFGILEVLISAGILIIVVGGVLTLERSAIKSNILSQEKTQAFNLTREGVELVRANRDTKWIDEEVNDWNEKFNLSENQDIAYFVIDCTRNCDLFPATSEQKESIKVGKTDFTRQIQVKKIPTSFNTVLKDKTKVTEIDSSGNVTEYGSGTPIYDITNTDNRVLTEVVSVVSWSSGGKEYQEEIPLVLTDWKP